MPQLEPENKVEKKPETPAEKPAEKIVEVKFPPGYSEEILKPLLDIYASRRQLDPSQRKTACIELAYSLAKIGISPQRSVESTLSYLRSLGEIVNSIPTGAETVGIKSSLLTRGALGAARKLEKSTEPDADARFERIFNRALLLKLVGNLDEGGGSDDDSKRLDRIEARLDSLLSMRFGSEPRPPEDLGVALERHSKTHHALGEAAANSGIKTQESWSGVVGKVVKPALDLIGSVAKNVHPPPRTEIEELPVTEKPPEETPPEE
ncbi:unnamed protein product [marine sediment metagenome]|uniref:Uncharacterized protein n=2 Tax=marine sediment metagenome TaxID=412755 RepID=X1KPI3_9ZZZZ